MTIRSRSRGGDDMKRLVLAACGAAALGLTTFASGAGAAPLSPVNPAPASSASGMIEDVRWRQVCRPVWRGPVRVVNCRNVWVGGPPRWTRLSGRTLAWRARPALRRPASRPPLWMGRRPASRPALLLTAGRASGGDLPMRVSVLIGPCHRREEPARASDKDSPRVS